MNVRIDLDPSMVRCDCGAIINFEAAKVDYTQKDDGGNVISKKAAEHMARFRIRC